MAVKKPEDQSAPPSEPQRAVNPKPIPQWINWVGFAGVVSILSGAVLLGQMWAKLSLVVESAAANQKVIGSHGLEIERLAGLRKAIENESTGFAAISSAVTEMENTYGPLAVRVRTLQNRVLALEKWDEVQDRKLIDYREEVMALSGPIGTVVAWPSSLPPSKGEQGYSELKHGRFWSQWAKCDGKWISQEDFSKLAEILGDRYDNDLVSPLPSGVTRTKHFRLPNFQGMFLRGHGGTSRNVSGKIGEPQGDRLRKHRHSIAKPVGIKAGLLPRISQIDAGGEDYAQASDDHKWLTGADDRSRNGEHFADETRPANYAVHWIIRVK